MDPSYQCPLYGICSAGFTNAQMHRACDHGPPQEKIPPQKDEKNVYAEESENFYFSTL